MSLLLDALKKAADDKKKLSSVSVADSQEQESISDKLTDNVKVSHQQETIDEVELTLDDLPVTATEAAKEVPEQVSGEPLLPNVNEVSSEDAMLEESKGDSAAVTEKTNMTEKHVISDEGLSLLIDKTNREIKKKNKSLIIIIALAAIVVIVISGAFYYSGMQTEIASLEQKHRISMQAMRIKTNSDNLPKNSEIIRNLVSDSNLDEKVLFAKQQIGENKKLAKSGVKKFTKNKKVSAQKHNVSIQKTKLSDPVGSALDKAWLAYDEGYYDTAKKSYEKALAMEKNNRDALLGLGAIAVLNKNNNHAREIYASLIEMNPRDPIATAAIASLRRNDGSLNSDKNYLLAMLKKNPSAPHLNFSLANIYAQKNKWVSAQKYYFNAWQNDSENADYIYNLAVSMDQLDKKKQAVQFYKDSLVKAKNKQIRFSREAVTKRINALTEL